VTVNATDLSGNVRTKSWTVNVPADAVSYAYDSNGNLTQKVDGSTTWTYEWNAENQLTRVLSNGSEVARYKYDPLRRRVEQVAGATTTKWAYDGEDVLRETSGATIWKYVHGPGIDEPLAKEDGGGALTYFHADVLGSVAKTTNQAGATVASYSYDAFGSLTGGAAGYGYTGREWDPHAGLYYYRARYYDPGNGRFLSEDPLRFIVGTNFYPYVENRPTNSRDPLGLAPDDPPFPPTFPPAPKMPGKCPDKRTCNPLEIQNAMAGTFTQIRRMYQGQQPTGTRIGGAVATVATRNGQWMEPWPMPPDQFDPYINPNIKDPCVRHCTRFHEWVHWTNMKKWSLQWSPAAAAIQMEYPAYVQELQCLFSFQ
jgi:RHS repeat-associated protein